MNVEKYLQHELQSCAYYQLTNTDQELLGREGMEAFLYKKLTSHKFRKWAVDDSTKAHVQRVIGIAVKQGLPLQVRFGFGGYKLWQLPSAPQVDWAEFFTLAYYCRYLAPIAAAYRPGVVFTFLSEDFIARRLNNLPLAATAAYGDSFELLLSRFRAQAPVNMQLKVESSERLFSSAEEFEAKLQAGITSMAERYRQMSAEEKQPALTSSALNICWDGVEDLTGLSDAQKAVKIEQSAMIHDAYRSLPERENFLRGPEVITIFTTPTRQAIPIGTTKSSVTKFWTGQGVLEGIADGFKPRILSPTQWEVFQAEGFERVPARIVEGNNFTSVPVKLYVA